MLKKLKPPILSNRIYLNSNDRFNSESRGEGTDYNSLD